MTDPRQSIADAGGLCSISDLADRWGISRQGARKVTRRDGFPAPVLTHGARELWPADEADDAYYRTNHTNERSNHV